MKSKIISLIAIIATLALMFVATLKVNNTVTNVEVQKAKGDETVQTGNQTEGDEAEEVKTYSFSMILNQIDKADKVNIGGNKVAITSENENVTFRVYDAITGSEIIADQTLEVNTYAIPENGARLQISGIKEGERNNLIIENKELVENYVATFKKLTVEVDSSDINSIRVSIKDITKLVNGEEVVTNGSEDETATFIYQEEDGTVKINNNSDLKIYYAFVANSELAEGKTGLTDAELEEVEWQEYNKETGYKAEKNGIVYSKTKYKDGAYSNVNNYIVNNVDKVAPIITLNDVEYNTSEYTAKISGTVKDGEATRDYAKSGLVGYAITTEDEEPTSYLEIENEENSIELDEIDVNGTYYVWTKDKAGNVTKKSIEVDIDFTTTEEEIKRVLILSAPNAELIGTTYVSLNEFLDTLDANNITADSGKVVAQVINEIKSETVEFENKDIVLDLNGYGITGRTQEPTINVNSGKLNIVDNKYDIANYISDEEKVNELNEIYHSNEGYGKIKSLHVDAINIKEDGTFTLGENTNLSDLYVVAPSKETPIIEGKEKGVYNENGIFNFYDGVIIGNTTIDGKISDTPSIYDPTTSEIENENRYKSVLEKVSGIEALIGKTRYTKLEDAIAAANDIKGTPDDQIKIDIVTNLAKEATVEVNDSKNIIIDMNGFNFTNNVQDYVIKNAGKLELRDSAGRSNITSTTYWSIYNNGELNINGVKVSYACNQASYGAIYNDGEGKLTINAGEVETLTANSRAVLNYGKMIQNGGDIKASNAYGVSNNSYFNNVDLSTARSSENYYFELNDNGELVSNNKGRANTNAHSYIEIDLSSYPENKDYIIDVNAKVSCSQYDDEHGYFIINESPEYVSMNTEDGRFGYDMGVFDYKDYFAQVKGGKKYYLHLGYHKHYYLRQAGEDAVTVRRIGVVDKELIDSRVEFNGGKITAKQGIINYAIEDLNINDFEIEATDKAINTFNRANIDIKNSKLLSSNYGIQIVQSDTGLEKFIDEIKISSDDNSEISGINNSSEKNLVIDGGIIKGNTYGVFNSESGKVEIRDVSISSSNSGIYNNQDGEIEVYDSTVTLADIGIYNYGNGSIKNVRTNVKGITAGIYNRIEGTVEVISGRIESEKNDNNYGIYNYSLGTITIGEKDSSVSTEDPVIVGNSTNTSKIGYGIYNNNSDGNINIYDGKIIGKVNYGIYGTINELEDKYDLNVVKDTNVETITLKNKDVEETDDDYVASIGNKKYTTLQKAIDDVESNNNETEITILKDIETARKIEIPNNKNIKINFNNNYLKSYVIEKSIVNNGILKLFDNSDNVLKVSSTYSKVFIENNKNLSYDNIIARNDKAIKMIDNKDKFEVKGGKLTTSVSNIIVNNNRDAEFILSGGEISSATSQIVENDGTFKVTGGVLRTTCDTGYDRPSPVLMKNGENGYVEITGGILRNLGQNSIIENKAEVKVTGGDIRLDGNFWPGGNAPTRFIKNMTSSSKATTSGQEEMHQQDL